MSSSDRGDRVCLAIGAGLLALYIAQAALGLEVPVLVRLQHHERYKVVTGCVLAATGSASTGFGSGRVAR